MQNRIKLKCDCEFIGEITFRDNRQLSGQSQLEYSLVGFNGQTYSSAHFISFRTLFDKLKPACPHCQNLLTLDHLVPQKQSV